MNKRLDEICFIRPVLIVLLIVFHSFAPWANTWPPFEGIVYNDFYLWIAQITYACMLPMFVFISGYLFSYQRNELNRVKSIKTLAVSKFKRLIIPSIVFSFLYQLIFAPQNSVCLLIWNSLNGYAHIWFLPMLFWCFILLYFLDKLNSTYIRITIICIFAIFFIGKLPFQLNVSFYYLLYFCAGYESRRYINKLCKYCNIRIILLLIFCFVTVFICSYYINDYVNANMPLDSFASKFLIHAEGNAVKIIYSLSAIFAILGISLCYVRNYNLNYYWIKIGEYCFGIYLFQQFVLEFLYYYINIGFYIDSNVVPFVGVVLSFVISLMFAYVTHKNKYLRQYI